MTEQEAKKKWCPKSDYNANVTNTCLGSDCMWWQWNEPMFNGPDSYVADPPPTGHCGGCHGKL